MDREPPESTVAAISASAIVAPEEKLDTANELLDVLSPQNWDGYPDVWIYRGQGDDLPLRAKAHRGLEVFAGFGVDPNPQGRETPRQARDRAEFKLIRNFLRELDRAGIPVPETDGGGFWSDPLDPMHVTLPKMALAQHHGIPTSLLDWSVQSMKAAYFAAASAAPDPGAGRFVVWALQLEPIERRHTKGDLEIVSAPQWSNDHLRAQAGLFTRFELDELTPLEDYLPRLAANHPYLKAPYPWLRKFSAPRRCARRLLFLLSNYGITGGTMFPGHEGAIRAMREKALWDRP